MKYSFEFNNEQIGLLLSGLDLMRDLLEEEMASDDEPELILHAVQSVIDLITILEDAEGTNQQ